MRNEVHYAGVLPFKIRVHIRFRNLLIFGRRTTATIMT